MLYLCKCIQQIKRIYIMTTALINTNIHGGNVETLATYCKHLQATTNNEIINAFLNDKTTPRKYNTTAVYRRILSHFAEFLNVCGLTWQRMNPQHVGLFRDYLIKQGKKANTINGYLSAVRALFRFISANGAGFDIAKPVANIKTQNEIAHLPIFADDCKAIIEASRTRTARNNKGEATTKESLRNYAIITLMLRCGLRCAEISGLNVGDLHTATTPDGTTLYYLQFIGKKKTEKSSFVKLTEKAFLILNEYVKTNRNDAPDDAPMFVTENGGKRGERLGVRSISKLCKNKLQEIGKDGKQYTAHSLRASFASNIYKATKSIEATQKALRHANTRTTEIYLQGISTLERLQDNNGFDVLDNVF